MNKQTLILGALGIAGVFALISLFREHASTSNSQSTGAPQLAQAPIDAPTYPAPPPLPPFTVNATPYYLTVNLPENRNLLTPPVQDDKCGCDSCSDTSLGFVIFTKKQLVRNAQIARTYITQGPNSGNAFAQFPPNLYPWLYMKGGNA